MRALRWERGWELHIDAERVTQSRTLTEAARVVRDYLALDGEPDAEVLIEPELDEHTRAELAAVRRAQQEAHEAALSAQSRYRGLVGELRRQGMGTADIARVLQISPGRVSQLSRA